MTFDGKIRYEKLQYDINREAAKKSASSSGKIHKYEYLTGEEIRHADQKRVIEQVKFAYSPLEKAFEKQTKAIEEHGKQLIKFSGEKDSLCLLREKKSSEEIDFNNLTYSYTDKSAPKYFVHKAH